MTSPRRGLSAAASLVHNGSRAQTPLRAGSPAIASPTGTRVTRDTRAQVFHSTTRKRVKHRKHPPHNPETPENRHRGNTLPPFSFRGKEPCTPPTTAPT